MKKCRICGSAVPSGTKLCKDCAAARKRAFAATVTQPLMLAAAGAPSVSQPRFAPKPAKRKVGPPPLKATPSPSTDPSALSPAISPVLRTPAAAERRTVAAIRRSSARRSRPAWVLVAVVGGLIALMVIGMLAARRSHGINDEVAPTTPAAPAVPAAASEVPPVAPTAPPSAGLNADGLVSQPVPLPAARKAPRKAPAPIESVASPPPEPEPAVVVEPPRPAPPPPRVVQPARVDPLQSLNDALTRCAGGDLLDRMSCEQNARSRFCGDSWGQVPQCPIGRGNDHGQ